jgi:hypothetical protein
VTITPRLPAFVKLPFSVTSTCTGFLSCSADSPGMKVKGRFCIQWLALLRLGLPLQFFLLFQACLGLRIGGIESKISFVRLLVPAFLNEARILNVQVEGGASVDFALVRHEQDLGVKVLRRQGDIEIVVIR